MKNNRLTLKALKLELDKLKKSNKVSLPASDIKPNKNKLYQKSSMFDLWVFSWVIYLSTKLPFINKFIALLSLYYGRTTWWKILVYIRKLFIIFNALIGVYVVYKTTGFGFDTFYANLIAMGNSYIEIFFNFNKRLYNWIYDFFDTKIVPGNPPTPKTTGGNMPTRDPIIPKIITANIEEAGYKPFSWSKIKEGGETSGVFSLRDLYASKPSDKYFDNPINVNINPSAWYKDLSTWLIIGGVVSLLGIGYLGYVYLFSSTAIDPTSPAGTVTPTLNKPVPNATGFSITSSISAITNNIKKLNPAYWFLTTTDVDAAHNNLMLHQSTPSLVNNNYYPFTSSDP